jgi:hypothetical protein
MTAADHDGQLRVPGTWVLCDFINHTNEQYVYVAVRQVLEYEGTKVFALGIPKPDGGAHLLHASIPLRDGRIIRLIPVFTTLAHAVEAIAWWPEWAALNVLELDGSAIVGELRPDEWVGVDIYSHPGEFLLPPAA